MINIRPPKYYTEGRDFERWMYELYRKLGTSDVTFDDIDSRSMNPVLGMIQDLDRKLETLAKDARNIKAELHSLKTKPAVTRSIRGKLAELERRIENIEGEL